MNSQIRFDEQFRVIICDTCKFVVSPGPAGEAHFRRHGMKGQELTELLNYMEALAPTISFNAERREDTSDIHPLLTTYNGFSCMQCRYLTTNRFSTTRHWHQAQHQGTSTFEPVKLQSWRAGKYADYWTVVDRTSVSSNTPNTQSTNDALSQIVSQASQQIREETKARLEIGDGQTGLDHDSTWVKEMKWATHFVGKNLVEIYDAAHQPGLTSLLETITPESTQDERDYARHVALLYESFDREVDRCSWRVDSVPKETLQCLGGITKGQPSGNPFTVQKQDRSCNKYLTVARRYLAFCWRAYSMGRTSAKEKLGMVFTDEQWGLMVDIILELDDDELRIRGASNIIHDSDHEASDDSGIFDVDDNYSDVGSDDGQDRTDRAGELPPLETLGLDQAVFRFMVASIKTKVAGAMYRNSLLCFCAAAGVRKQPLGYYEAYLYTAVLAALQWTIRIFFLELCFQDEPRDVDSITYDAMEAFRLQHEEWMCLGTYTVMNRITNWMAYGKGHRNKTGGAPTVHWSEDEQVLHHSGERLVVHDFQAAACQLMLDAEKAMDELFARGWGHIKSEIDMLRIVDSMISVGAGKSFVDHEKNQWLQPGPEKVVYAMQKAIFDKTQCTWKQKGVLKWLRQLRQFRELLMIIVHVWSGQPGRGPEITTMRHCDGQQVLRNVFIYDGQVMIVTDRDKMKAIRDLGRKVARFLPDDAGRMMVAYIAWLLPAELLLTRVCGLKEPVPKLYEFMWRHRASSVWGTDRLSSVMIHHMQRHIKIRMGVARYRPIAIEMGRRIRGLVMKQVEGLAGENDDEGVEIDEMTGDVIDVGGSWNIVWDLQSTHGTKMARMGYAVHVGMVGRLQPEMIATFRSISRLWQQFLRKGEHERLGQKRKLHEDDCSESSAHSKARKRQKTGVDMEGIDIPRASADGLRALMGAGSQWRSEKQMESMHMILSLKGDSGGICVLPTGAGKSLLFMIPTQVRGSGTTVVIVPFTALRLALYEEARRLGIDVIMFEPTAVAELEATPRVARMVIISADTMNNEALQGYLEGLQKCELLGRIIIDEAHTAITDSGYRRKLLQLKSATKYECPVVLLTATLPKRFERWFREELLAAEATMVRDRTTKRNCRYEVNKVKSGAVDAAIIAHVKRLSQKMRPGQLGVVYAQSRKQCEALAEAIGCDGHRSMMAAERLADIRSAWMSGHGHAWIVATSGLGTGIDVRGITHILHAGMPYGLVDFVQQTGRGGRQPGEEVLSLVVHDGRPPRDRLGQSEIVRVNEFEMYRFLTTPGCRRQVLSAFMDGVEDDECAEMEGCKACDQCAPAIRETAGMTEAAEGCINAGENNKKGDSSKQSSPQEGRWRTYIGPQGRAAHILHQWLDDVAGECVTCHIRQAWQSKYGKAMIAGEEVKDHTTDGRMCEPRQDGGYIDMRKRVTLSADTCCFRCKLPLDWRKESKEREGGEECVYMDKILPTILQVGTDRRVRGWMEEKYGYEHETEKGFLRWLAGAREFHGTKGCNMHMLWEGIILKLYKGKYN